MAETVNRASLLAGTAEAEITPPIGTLLAGSLQPRVSIGVQDPLFVKAVALECAGRQLVYVVFDLVGLPAKVGAQGVALAAEATGIPAECIVWCATHTHTGPYVTPSPSAEAVVNEKWLASLPDRMSECVQAAWQARVPVGFSRLRSFHYGLGHNRRVTLKSGAAINTWNLKQTPEDIQSVGASGPVDPEIGIFAFDDREGRLQTVLFHYTLHTNTNFRFHFSADYPGVVSARLRERFGAQVKTLFMPGACADINTVGPGHRETGDALAEKIIEALEKRRPGYAPLALGSAKRQISVPRQDFGPDQEERIANSGWPVDQQEYFLRQLETLRREGVREDTALLQAWRLGEIGFASFPGELFVEWGLQVKRESPFPWTYPVELGGGAMGYLVTERAAREGGYEPLGKIKAEGVGMMVQEAIGMLKRLYQEG